METDNQLLVRSLISKIGPVDMDMVIAADKMPNGKNVLKLNGRRVEDGEAQALKHEAELIEQTRLYRTLVETLRYQAHRRMFEDSQKSEDVFVSGKFLLHAISTFEHIIWAAKNPQLLGDEKVIPRPTKRRVDGKRSITNS